MPKNKLKEAAASNHKEFVNHLFEKPPKDAYEAHLSLNADRMKFRNQWQQKHQELTAKNEYIAINDPRELITKWYSEITETSSPEGIKQGQQIKLIESILFGEPTNNPRNGKKTNQSTGFNQPFSELALISSTAQTPESHHSLTESLLAENKSLLINTAFSLRAILETYDLELTGVNLSEAEVVFVKQLQLACDSNNQIPLTTEQLASLNRPKELARVLKHIAITTEEMRDATQIAVNTHLLDKLRLKYHDQSMAMTATKEYDPNTPTWKTKYDHLVSSAQVPLPTLLSKGDVNGLGLRHAFINAAFAPLQ